jgi:hypothetical protein
MFVSSVGRFYHDLSSRARLFSYDVIFLDVGVWLMHQYG